MTLETGSVRSSFKDSGIDVDTNAAVSQSHARSADILFLKHDSSIFKQSSNPVCGSRKSQASSPWAKLHRAQPVHSIMENPLTGLDDCQNILLACFRKRMSVDQTFRPQKAKIPRLLFRSDFLQSSTTSTRALFLKSLSAARSEAKRIRDCEEYSIYILRMYRVFESRKG